MKLTAIVMNKTVARPDPRQQQKPEGPAPHVLTLEVQPTEVGPGFQIQVPTSKETARQFDLEDEIEITIEPRGRDKA